MVDVRVDRRRCALVYVRVDVCRDALAGRDVRVQVGIVRRASRHAIAEIAVGVQVRRCGCTLIHVAVGVQVRAVHRTGVDAVHRLIDGAGRNVGVEVVVGRGAGGRILVDVRRGPRLHVIVRVGRCAGGRIDVIVVVRGRAGTGRDVIVIVIVRIRARRRAVGGCVIDVVRGRLGKHKARPASCNQNEVAPVNHQKVENAAVGGVKLAV